MIQINLIPDVKSEFLKTQSTRRAIQTIAFIISVAAVGLVIFAFMYVKVWQGRYTTALQNDIDDHITELQQDKDLDKVLTIRNQLDSLDRLHEDKVLSSNIAGILASITPADIIYDAITIDFDDSEISFKGDGDTTLALNRFADILKFSTYNIIELGEDGQPEVVDSDIKAFKEVVSDFSLSSSDDTSSFTISAIFDEDMFLEESIDVQVSSFCGAESCITTRSEVERPKNLFEASEQDVEGGN